MCHFFLNGLLDETFKFLDVFEKHLIYVVLLIKIIYNC